MQQKFFTILMGCVIFAGCLVSSCGDPENEAREMLNQALFQKQEGNLVGAEETFKKIAAEYPKTIVATEALKELEHMKTAHSPTSILSEIASQTTNILLSKMAMDYENKKKCIDCEMDAFEICGAIGDFFANPANKNLPTKDELKPFFSKTISNPYSISGDVDNFNIIIQVTDASGLCSKEYQDAYDDDHSNWNNGVFTKIIK